MIYISVYLKLKEKVIIWTMNVRIRMIFENSSNNISFLHRNSNK